jgi:hypothetical protein
MLNALDMVLIQSFCVNMLHTLAWNYKEVRKSSCTSFSFLSVNNSIIRARLRILLHVLSE